MIKVVLPGTDLCISRLAFGTARLHHLLTSRERQTLLSEAADLGFSHFDASPYYGFGISEYELGRFLRQGRRDLTVASKVGLFPPGGRTSSVLAVWCRKAAGRVVRPLSRPIVDWSVSAAEKSLEQTLRALGRDWLDVLFLHETTPRLLDRDLFLDWIARQKQAGKIRHCGLAGPLERFATWLNHPLAKVLQVHDGSDVLALARAGREPQFTYGALSSARGKCLVADAIRAALERNPRGSLVVSTRRMDHLHELTCTVD
jgi:aryl-alcohol dehydrogenase-like predicted oxidoreductase